jgi:hypothetical protein
MEIAKLYDEEIFQIKKHLYNTEKAICYALDQLGLKLGDDFVFFKEIDNIPFTKSKKHKVDIMLISRKDRSKLYVEIKGQMTYLEVNKLRYLHDRTPHFFYILQLTELDWIKPYKGKTAKAAYNKSKTDFEKQINELVEFVNGNVTGEELSRRSIQRLNDYIVYRNGDLKRWKVVSDNPKKKE